MRRKTVPGIMLSLLLIGMLILTFNIQPVEASRTIYIKADGSIVPSTANITSTDNVIYYFTDNNYDSIVVERDNIVVDGAGHTLRGTRAFRSKGIDLSGRSNITIKNMETKAFYYGIYLIRSSNNTISGNNITKTNEGIYLGESSNNNISGNNITKTNEGIWLWFSSNNVISDNIVSSNGLGIWLAKSSSNILASNDASNNRNHGIMLGESNNSVLSGNTISSNEWIGIWLDKSSNNTLVDNIASNNDWGIRLDSSSNNVIFHNNFIENTRQIVSFSSINTWDNGYPSGGNYWSDHVCTGNPSDGSQPYTIDENNIDHYPFQDPNGWLLPPKPVGGKATPINMPVNKPETPTLWIWLTTILLPFVATAVFIKLKKKRARTRKSTYYHFWAATSGFPLGAIK